MSNKVISYSHHCDPDLQNEESINLQLARLKETLKSVNRVVNETFSYGCLDKISRASQATITPSSRPPFCTPFSNK